MRWYLFPLVVAVVVVVIVAGLGWDAQRFLTRPVATGTSVDVIIKPGAGLHQVAQQLASHGVFRGQRKIRYFSLYARASGAAKQIRSGEYLIKPAMTPVQILQMLVAGKVRQHRLTIVDGWTFKQLRAAIAANPAIRHTLKGKTGEQIMQMIGANVAHPEGECLPETYLFVRGTTDVSILKRCYAAMQKVLHDLWSRRADKLPFDTPYKALIMASIVERETAAPQELPRVAGVFVRRLRKGMRLQSDPTVIYGMQDYHGKIHLSDLRHDTPYNTYTRKGLPPTPISLPNKAAIKATLHPAKGKALYFVAKGNGTHKFSATLAQHNAAVRKYQLHQ